MPLPSKTFDGVTLTVGPLPAMKAATLLLEIGAFVGPTLARSVGLLDALRGGGDGSGVDAAALGSVADALAVELKQPATFQRLAEELFATTHAAWADADGKQHAGPLFDSAGRTGTFDLAFQGKVLTALPPALKFAFEVQYGNFSAALGARLAAAFQAELARARPSRDSPSAPGNSGAATG